MLISRASRAVLAVLLVTAVIAPAAQAAPAASADPAAGRGRPLAELIAPDGTVRTDTGYSGTIDLAGWTIAGDLVAGEAPRFTRIGAAGGASPAWSAVHPAAAGDWSALGATSALDSYVVTLAATGSTLYVGGNFMNAAGIPEADYLARWNGSAWSAVGSDGGAFNDVVNAIAIAGSNVYVGGYFYDAAGIAEADAIVTWNGSAWSALGGTAAIAGFVSAIVVSGANVYVGGTFTDAAGIAEADNVAKWNGTAWSALGSNGAGNGAIGANVAAIAVTGSDVYVGGDYTDAAGLPKADYLAKWNGSTWSAVGDNGSGGAALTYQVAAIAIVGSDVYVGGRFSDAAGIPEADYIARWNGSVWSALGSDGSGDGALQGFVLAISVAGSELYMGGTFRNAAGIAEADYLARWNGSSWSALGSNGAGDGALAAYVYAVAAPGSNVYMGGDFVDAAGIATADHAARVEAGTTSLSLRTKSKKVTAGRKVSIGATVTRIGATATGTVQFRVGSASGKKLGSCTLTAGACSLSTSKIPAGTTRIVAQYAGGVGYVATTATLKLTVVAALEPSPAPSLEPSDPAASPQPAPSPDPAAG